ncbi:MAG: DUF4417 domain-containing protein [Clostridia bacterium]|nr:DUF4417 domain-containing protein [Clostridia bacterium]
MEHIGSIVDLLDWINLALSYLQGKNAFDPAGWPIFDPAHFLQEWPDQITTFYNRNSRKIKDKSKTLICFFASDREIYPRFVKVLSEIEIYRSFMGAAGADISITEDMDLEMQECLALANQLFLAILAVNGIPIVMNTRNGTSMTLSIFRHIPRGTACISGFLGCKKSRNYWEASTYTDKILNLFPDKLMIYGKNDRLINEQLDLMGINYRYYEDFHRMSIRKGGI